MQSSWSSQSELESLLPNTKPIKIKSGIDRYGFSYLLADLCKMNTPLRSFANWVHGWIWDEHPTAESLHCSKLPHDVTIVVRNEMELLALKNEGFKCVLVGGLPFAYVKKQHKLRNQNALLAIPPHSAEVDRISFQQKSYMDYLESLKLNYDGIYVSIHYLDWDGAMYKAARKRGLNVIQGARPDDANCLIRMRSLFEAFEHVTSNVMGSHFIYALDSGCRFSFCGPMFNYNQDMILDRTNSKLQYSLKIMRLEQIYDPAYLRQRFGRFFVELPNEGFTDKYYAESELGYEKLLLPNEIIGALGWTWKGQLSGYSRGAIRRIGRQFK